MKIWFDTEFYENGTTIDLISIGAVREDGATYYAETMECLYFCRQSEWLAANVAPHLKLGNAMRYRQRIKSDLIEFAGPNPEFWAYYASYDWVALCQLYGTMMELPEGWPMYVRDLKQEIDRVGCGKPPEQTYGEHHALSDALWTRDAWLWLQSAPSLSAGESGR